MLLPNSDNNGTDQAQSNLIVLETINHSLQRSASIRWYYELPVLFFKKMNFLAYLL
ncbi:hypothetical protein EXN66_Car010660 [Channa argus]|uniref:Uncharacterized protein n=1 Tax=Channa argus TaxID=215402 RepID=A0A6G1PXX5_CHAAH|nr:hypothetical protein EXN66_Car010660 [Channa argus]